jgi:hypothetical protein
MGNDSQREQSTNTPPELATMRATQTAPGVRLLRELWDIPASHEKRTFTPPEHVSTDIYDTGSSKTSVPRRSASHR